MAEQDPLMEKLGQLLNSEEGMNQLQQAARMLGIGGEESGYASLPSAGQLSGLLGNLGGTGGEEGMDPQMLLRLGRMMQNMNKDNPSAALLRALRPLLREERRAKVDEAIRLLQLVNLLPLLREGMG